MSEAILAFHSQLSVVMETVLKAAMFEITRLVEVSFLEEVMQSRQEVEALKQRLQQSERRLMAREGDGRGRCEACGRAAVPRQEGPQPGVEDGCDVKEEKHTEGNHSSCICEVPDATPPGLSQEVAMPTRTPDVGAAEIIMAKKYTRKYTGEDAVSMIFDGNASDMEQLEEGDDDDDEECTPKAMSGEESSDTSNEEDLQEGDDQTSTEEEGPTSSQYTATKTSARKKVTKKAYTWRKKPFEPPGVEFDECADEALEDRSEFTPYMYFKQFVTDEMLQLVAYQTNLYSVQKDGKSLNTTAQEIEQFLGMYLCMGLVQMPNVRAYWEMETKYPKVSDVMPRDRFLKLLTLIHFEDNLNMSEDAQKDKLWKLRPWLDKLREQCLRIPPEEHHAVDEIMVPFKGKSQLKAYMPGKPHKWGFKMWGRAGQSGFLYDFDVCQGAENPDKERSDVGVSEDVVLKLTSTLPAGKNHKVFADNYFTSVILLEHLRQRGIYYLGTVRMNRVQDCNMMEEKEMKKKGRGSMDFRVNQENIIIVRWCDNKAVNLLSSFVGIEPVGEVKRWDRKTKTYVMVPRPAIVEMYNTFMGGVDLHDMLSALYKYSFKCRRWYMYIWWHTVTVAVINGWILYRRDQKKLEPQNKTMPLRKFQASVATSLIRPGKGQVKCGRPLSSPEAETPPPRKRPTSSVPPDTVDLEEDRTDSLHSTEDLKETTCGDGDSLQGQPRQHQEEAGEAVSCEEDMWDLSLLGQQRDRWGAWGAPCRLEPRPQHMALALHPTGPQPSAGMSGFERAGPRDSASGVAQGKSESRSGPEHGGIDAVSSPGEGVWVKVEAGLTECGALKQEVEVLSACRTLVGAGHCPSRRGEGKNSAGWAPPCSHA
ncbi:hypothetical protein SKAU_G00032130 [Synaphobranchus kaupii]|uniref:PiggyBac transposable element-derived protein domain-containing protein n=1 Tax=Synaphobranchus kaupii TaxID=118154 RepID=A0A9Q1GF74_SYNKA|nr:hypothetical protein SKAU_G00032130 [Synaphobranchus kaupii]